MGSNRKNEALARSKSCHDNLVYHLSVGRYVRGWFASQMESSDVNYEFVYFGPRLKNTYIVWKVGPGCDVQRRLSPNVT